MAYRMIDPELKFRVVKDYWATNNVRKTAKNNGVSRDVVYTWSKLAENAMRETFKKTTPGRRGVDLETENKNLRVQLQELSNVYHKISQGKLPDTEPPPFVVECPECHSHSIPKNGKVYTKTHGLRQRFLCRSCSISIYIDLKKNF